MNHVLDSSQHEDSPDKCENCNYARPSAATNASRVAPTTKVLRVLVCAAHGKLHCHGNGSRIITAQWRINRWQSKINHRNGSPVRVWCVPALISVVRLEAVRRCAGKCAWRRDSSVRVAKVWSRFAGVCSMVTVEIREECVRHGSSKRESATHPSGKTLRRRQKSGARFAQHVCGARAPARILRSRNVRRAI